MRNIFRKKNNAERVGFIEEFDNHGWEFDYNSLPYFTECRDFPFRTDDFFESGDGRYLCLIYSICELRMCSYLGKLAIFENKSSPELLFEVPKIAVPKQTPLFNSANDTLFLMVEIYNKEEKKTYYPFLSIDLKKKEFAIIPYPTASHWAKISQQSEDEFLIEPQNIAVKLSDLKYYPIEKINSIRAVTDREVFFE